MSGHKDLQICRQVQDAISLALSDIDDPLLDELVLQTVLPAPNSSRVEVLFITRDTKLDVDAALESLNAHMGELREEVAAEITRKRVPELVFRIDRIAAP